MASDHGQHCLPLIQNLRHVNRQANGLVQMKDQVWKVHYGMLLTCPDTKCILFQFCHSTPLFLTFITYLATEDVVSTLNRIIQIHLMVAGA